MAARSEATRVAGISFPRFLLSPTTDFNTRPFSSGFRVLIASRRNEINFIGKASFTPVVKRSRGWKASFQLGIINIGDEARATQEHNVSLPLPLSLSLSFFLSERSKRLVVKAQRNEGLQRSSNLSADETIRNESDESPGNGGFYQGTR